MKTEKIGIDFHGVINKNPVLFKGLAEAAQKLGWEIHIISGGPHEYIQKYLAAHNIPFHKIWCIFDFYNQKQEVKFSADGSFYVYDELWNRAKADYCQREKISLHIDDSRIYGNYFTTGYCLYDTSTETCLVSGNRIALNGAAQEVLRQLSEQINSDA